MNLNELWVGNDYAWYEWKGRNEPYRSNARRVKLVRTYKRRASYENERLSGYAEVLICDSETGEIRTNSLGEHITKEVRARDLAMRWEEYAEIKAHREAQREKIAREREDAEARESDMKSKLSNLLTERYGIPQQLIYNITETGVHLSRKGLEEELGIAQ